MKFGTILVAIDGAPSAAARLDAAIDLAERFGARLRVLSFALLETPIVIGDTYGADVFATLGDAARADAERALEAARSRLERTVQPVEAEAISCLTVSAGDVMAREALYADLAVVGAPADEAPYNARLLEGALFESPTPVLVWPTARTEARIGRRAAIAWDARKEAARAIRSAWPLIEAADAVSLMTVQHMFGAEPYGPEPGAGAAAWLAHRGVSVELRQLAGSPVAEVIMRDLREQGADLLVMGGYGHSRTRQALFGGVTETLLRECPIPMVMTN